MRGCMMAVCGVKYCDGDRNVLLKQSMSVMDVRASEIL